MKKDVKLNHPVNKVKKTFGQAAADKLTAFVGSWSFILTVLIFIAFWMTLNVIALIQRWDPYPFILLNFVLSCLAAIEAPIILMSQNREAQRDRLRAEYDYEVNKLAEREIRDPKVEVKYLKGEISYLRKLLEKSR